MSTVATAVGEFATAKAKELCGSVLVDPEVGRLAVLRDPQGATFRIITPDPAS